MTRTITNPLIDGEFEIDLTRRYVYWQAGKMKFAYTKEKAGDGKYYAFVSINDRIVEWVRRVGIRARETNNIVERLHGTFKDRLRPMRGLKNDKRAKSLVNGYVINYNFCRKHQSLGMTPAKASGIEVQGWKQLIENAQIQKVKQEMPMIKEIKLEVKS